MTDCKKLGETAALNLTRMQAEGIVGMWDNNRDDIVQEVNTIEALIWLIQNQAKQDGTHLDEGTG